MLVRTRVPYTLHLGSTVSTVTKLQLNDIRVACCMLDELAEQFFQLGKIQHSGRTAFSKHSIETHFAHYST